MDEVGYKIKALSEVYLCKLKRLINRHWDLIDMMVYEGCEVDWEKILYL